MQAWLVLHIIAVICWFAGLFYLPRIFVYHAMSTEPACHEQFKVMAYKLYHYIMRPSFYTVIISGAGLLVPYVQAGVWPTWLLLKLVLVFFLVGFHHMCGRFLRLFAQDENVLSHRFYRIFNEVPTVLLIGIVSLVIFKLPI